MPENAITAADPFPQHWVDRRSMPPRGEGSDGRWYDISNDPRLPDLFREFKDDACEHPEKVILKRADSLGRPFFTRYCKFCGVKFRDPLPRVKAESEGVSDISEEQIERVAELYTEARDQRLGAIVASAVERAENAAEESRELWSREYEDYLRSPQWKRRVAKIMQRAEGVCEGCLSQPAEEVHHLTYEHVREEFAFELVALCSACHRRIHGREAA